MQFGMAHPTRLSLTPNLACYWAVRVAFLDRPMLTEGDARCGLPF